MEYIIVFHMNNKNKIVQNLCGHYDPCIIIPFECGGLAEIEVIQEFVEKGNLKTYGNECQIEY